MLDVLKLRITATVLHGVAQICTLLRLAYQTRKHRMWLDDGFVGLAMLCSVAWLACFWIETDVEGVGPLVQSHLHRLRAVWIDSTTFLTVVWFTRISVLLATVRLAPPGLIPRQIPFFASIFFVMMWASLLAQRIYFCHHDRAWEAEDEPQCTNSTMKLTGLVFELFSDAVLVASPIAALTFGSVARDSQRRLLNITLCSALVFMGLSVAHAVFIITKPGKFLEELTAIVQSGASLLFSNLVTGIMFVHRQLNPDADYPDETLDRNTYKNSRSKSIKGRIGSPKALHSTHIHGSPDGHESFYTSSPMRYVGSEDTLISNDKLAPVSDKVADLSESPFSSPSYLPENGSGNGNPYGVVPSPGFLDPYAFASYSPSSNSPNSPFTPYTDNAHTYSEDNGRLFRPTSYQSSISCYSQSGDAANGRESSLSTYPMLQDQPELSPIPTPIHSAFSPLTYPSAVAKPPSALIPGMVKPKSSLIATPVQNHAPKNVRFLSPIPASPTTTVASTGSAYSSIYDTYMADKDPFTSGRASGTPLSRTLSQNESESAGGKIPVPF